MANVYLDGASSELNMNGTKPDLDIVRRSAAFPPDVWGDYFLRLSQDEKMLESMRKEAKKLKEEVLRFLQTKEGQEKLELIDTLFHLGVSYNFQKEIEEALEKMYKTYLEAAEEDNLYTLALRFRLLRQHGWNVSSDVFYKFKEGNYGEFKESVASDVVGMLSLYEASFVGKKEDKILDEASVYTARNLRASLSNIDDPILAERVSHSLELPLHKRLQRLEATYFISLYEREDAHNMMLLRFAKLDYNLLQALHQNEMQALTKWWKKIDLVGKMKFPRDRLTECYLWPLGAFFEPQYSRGRVFATKITKLTSIIDDLYDVYGTQDELHRFTDAIQRWDKAAATESLPDYVKPLYEALLDTVNDFEDELATEGNAYRASFMRQAMKNICKAYLEEAKWYGRGSTPKVEEYLEAAQISCGYPVVITACFTGARNITTANLLEWIQSYPKYIKDTCRICRVVDDIKTYKFEEERGHVASVVACYMEEHKCKEEEALERLSEDVSNTWKDINAACMQPTPFPMEVMNTVRNLSRVMEILYQYGDGYTFANDVTKERLTVLLKDPIPI